jgi:hypothetical protein
VNAPFIGKLGGQGEHLAVGVSFLRETQDGELKACKPRELA